MKSKDNRLLSTNVSWWAYDIPKSLYDRSLEKLVNFASTFKGYKMFSITRDQPVVFNGKSARVT